MICRIEGVGSRRGVLDIALGEDRELYIKKCDHQSRLEDSWKPKARERRITHPRAPPRGSLVAVLYDGWMDGSDLSPIPRRDQVPWVHHRPHRGRQPTRGLPTPEWGSGWRHRDFYD